MLSRRELGGKVAVGAAALLAAGVARGSLAPASKDANSLTQAGPNGAPDAQHLPGTDAEQTADAAVVEQDVAKTLAAQPPWELVHPLALGSTIAHGWSLAGFTGAVDGSCVATIENERGRQIRIHLCRNDGNPQGLVYTREFDLVVMNGGRGDIPTEEGLGQAVAGLAHVVARNEDRQQPVVAALLPHAERVRMCAETADHRLR